MKKLIIFLVISLVSRSYTLLSAENWGDLKYLLIALTPDLKAREEHRKSLRERSPEGPSKENKKAAAIKKKHKKKMNAALRRSFSQKLYASYKRNGWFKKVGKQYLCTYPGQSSCRPCACELHVCAHINFRHTNETPYVCDRSCDSFRHYASKTAFSSWDGYKKHMRNYHSLECNPA